MNVKHDFNGKLYHALLSEEVEKVKELCKGVDEGGLHVLTIHDDTVLHAATYSKQPALVTHLLDELPAQHLDKMTRQNHQGNTILHDAAKYIRSVDVVKKVLLKAPGLLFMRNHLGETPLFQAVRCGNKEMFDFLAERIFQNNQSTRQFFLQSGDRTTILHIAIIVQNFERDTSWEATYPGVNQSKPRLHKYSTGSPSVEKGAVEVPLMSSLGQREREKGTPLFLATKSGCVQIVEEILKRYPQAVEHIDEKGRSILHVAIKFRQLEIFELVTKLGEVPMRRLVRRVDNQGNSILHTVGIRGDDYVPENLRGAAFELQRELHWFERVEEVTPVYFVNHRNHMKLTAKGLFSTTNKELQKAATEWLKRTSEGCTVVAVLIATVAFAAAYTVPGGPNDKTGFPLLVNHPLFALFTATDVLSLSFALTSVVIFLSIVTSAFRLADFKDSLPTKLMLGFTFLFLSVSMMMIAFAATVLLMIYKGESWTKVVLYAISFLPVGIFALSYFPLYVSLSETCKYLLKKVSKYCSSICNIREIKVLCSEAAPQTSSTTFSV
ncbi:hypothetical protein CJ030_MR0G003163 [Morella rubra]|uniref:PGG domain-containing protein n=1 Tax=Morella rubra TaxID=262757 RepID=A0A6A1UNZ0_9ROSI|nr:hypothetical protein CJ030_MR0G003163 [Morella rubra]